MNRLKRIWSRLNPIHVTILLIGIALLPLAALGVALGLQAAGWLALPGLVILTYYWWGGMLDLVDTNESFQELAEQRARRDPGE